jgi:hypothetical protein
MSEHGQQFDWLPERVGSRWTRRRAGKAADNHRSQSERADRDAQEMGELGAEHSAHDVA